VSEPVAVTIGEETRFTGRAVAALVGALVFAGGVGLGIYQRLTGIEVRLAVVETRVNELAQQHASRETTPARTATASLP